MATTTAISPWLSKRNSLSFAFVILLVIIGVSKAHQLSPNFYSSTCPQVYQIISSLVARAVRREPRMGASLLRLHFHDCFVNGCDASVLLDDTATFTGEKSAAQNVNSLRGFEVIDTIKNSLEMICPRTVSCADILAVAARDSVALLNGPRWAVGVGRRDATTASLSAANSQIPAPTLNIDALTTAFSNKGFSAREMVALSGSHTIGQARCSTFRKRIYDETNINPTYANSVRRNCPRISGRGDDNLSPLDTSPAVFNNDYFANLVSLRGLLHSDQQLLTNGSTGDQVRAYAANSASFFNDFVAAMLKMSNLSPLTGVNGEIRTNCRRRNSFSFS